MQKYIVAILKIIGLFLLPIILIILTLYIITSKRTDQIETEKTKILHRNENLVPSNLMFWEDETNKTICWKQCDYLNGICNIEVCSTGQLVALDCGGHKCWIK